MEPGGNRRFNSICSLSEVRLDQKDCQCVQRKVLKIGKESETGGQKRWGGDCTVEASCA